MFYATFNFQTRSNSSLDIILSDASFETVISRLRFSLISSSNSRVGDMYSGIEKFRIYGTSFATIFYVIKSMSKTTNLIMFWFLVNSTYYSAWISDRHTIWWDISGNNAACSNHTVCPNFNPRKNDDAPADPAPVPDLNRQRIYLAEVFPALRDPVWRQAFCQFHRMRCRINLHI